MSFSIPASTLPEGSQNYLPLSGEGCGQIHREQKSAFAEAGLRTLEDFFSVTGKALSKPGLGKRYRAKIELPHNDKTFSVFLKRYAGEKLRNLVQRWFEDGERTAIALREVRVANALQKIGIGTFHPLAWGWTKNWGTNQKSFVVMSQVPGDSVEHWLTGTDLDWQKKRQLIEQLAVIARQMHGSGWFHRDFYLCHIFIHEFNGTHQLALVDLARMFRPRWRVNRWRIKDLAQLNYSASPQYFSRTMRLRFARFYFGVDRLTASHKQLLRKVAQRSAGIARRELRQQ